MKSLLAIDPGSSSGAIAFRSLSGQIGVLNMPDSLEGIWALLRRDPAERAWVKDGFAIALENVGGSMPGNSARSARTFAAHVGALQMALVANSMWAQTTQVRPQVWMKDLFGDALPRAPRGTDTVAKSDAKKARKAFIYARAQEFFPTLKFTLRQADAVAMLWWLMKKEEVK